MNPDARRRQRRIDIPMSEEEIAQADALALRWGCSRVEAVRRAVRGDERGAIMAWLRRDGPGGAMEYWGGQFGGTELSCAADGIEQGEHLKGRALGGGDV